MRGSFRHGSLGHSEEEEPAVPYGSTSIYPMECPASCLLPSELISELSAATCTTSQ